MGLHSRVFLISFSLFSPTSLPPSSQRTRARPYPNLFAHVHLCLGAFGKKIGKRWTEVSGRREGGEEVESAGSPDCVCVGRGTPAEALRGGQLRNPARARRLGVCTVPMPAGARVHWDLRKLGWLRSPGLARSRFPGGCRFPRRASPGAVRLGRRPDPRALGPGGAVFPGPGRPPIWRKLGLRGGAASPRAGRRAPEARGGRAGLRALPLCALARAPGAAPRGRPLPGWGRAVLQDNRGSSPRRDLSRRLPPRFPGGFLSGAILGLLSLKTLQKHKPEDRLGTHSRRKPTGNGSSFAIALILELPKSYALCVQPDQQHGKWNSAFCVCTIRNQSYLVTFRGNVDGSRRAVTMRQDPAKETQSLPLGSPTLTGVVAFNCFS